MRLVPYVRGSVLIGCPLSVSGCVSVSVCLFGVPKAQYPPANEERALFGVRPYWLLRAGPFVSNCQCIPYD